MKFAKYLAAESVPEWRRKYINYKYMKKLLKVIEKIAMERAQRELAQSSASGLQRQNSIFFTRLPSPFLGSGDKLQQQSSSNQNLPSRSDSLKSDFSEKYLNAVSASKSDPLAVDGGSQKQLTVDTKDTIKSKSTKENLQQQQQAPSPSKLRYSPSIRKFMDRARGRSRSQYQTNVVSPLGVKPMDEEETLQSILATKSEQERKFFQFLDEELEKINDFYVQRENDCRQKLETLQNQCAIYEEEVVKKKQLQKSGYVAGSAEDNSNNNTQAGAGGAQSAADNEEQNLMTIRSGAFSLNYKRAFKSSKNAKAQLRNALMEYYRYLELLKNFQILNYTGFVKILKKFDKTAGWKSQALYMHKVDAKYFHTSNVVDGFLSQTEQLFLKFFAGGNKKEARQQLRLPNYKQKTHHSTMWRIGLYIGLSIPVLVRTFAQLIDLDYRQRFPETSDLVQIYAGFSIPIIFMFLFAINQYGWTMANINYKFIFELDPRDNLDYHQFTEFGAFLFMLWSYFVYLTFVNPFESFFDIRLYYPLIFLCVVVVLLVTPVPVFYWTSRRWMLQTLFRLLISPRYAVEYRDFFIADELCSMVYFLSSIQLFVCVYINDFDDTAKVCNIGAAAFSPAINLLPSWIRFLQCLRRWYDTRLAFPHLVNGGKYFVAMLTGWLSMIYNQNRTTATLTIWIISTILTTCYAYNWDILMDWGFFAKGSKNKYLRNDLFYEHKWVYYFAIVSNFFLRISWVWQVSVGLWGQSIDIRALLYALALMEILRRFQWNFFRMENEHLNNCGQFRAIKEIPLPFEIREDNGSDVDVEMVQMDSGGGNGDDDGSDNSGSKKSNRAVSPFDVSHSEREFTPRLERRHRL
ncbi:hypothetical protein MP228_005299 [Amoeboaphelidium protococcarum]|nr:hypothetical protein MP228_005299 [Amoeboaphelidium protococcarum]